MIIIGIDPGTATGWAHWDSVGQIGPVLREVEGMTAYEAERRLRDLRAALPADGLLVVLEDANLRGARGAWCNSRGRLQGVGSVKRDSKRWVEFLRAERIPFITIPPRRRATKKDASLFARITGWTGRTNQHGRDAAMFVFGIDNRRAASLLETANRRAA